MKTIRKISACALALLFILTSFHAFAESGNFDAQNDETSALSSGGTVMKYDDRLDVSGRSVEILDPGAPSSCQVGYGVADGTQDEAVIRLEGGKLVACGIGKAVALIDGKTTEITVTPAPISLLLLIGQSNMRGSEGNADQSIICPEGKVYATYGDDRGATNTALSVDTARLFAPSALAGAYSAVNVEGTTECLSGYPLYSLAERGDGKIGPDSGFAYEWVKQTGEKVWVVNAAHGGTSINEWLDGKTQFEECEALFKACEETLSKEIAAGHYTLSHMGYFWCQGCQDSSMTASAYKNKFLTMHESLKSVLAFDHDLDESTEKITFEFAGIIPILYGRNSYRAGVYNDELTVPYYESFQLLTFNGPRAAQYLMCADKELPDIWMVCNIGESWVWMPDGTNGVEKYFTSRYPSGTINYETQKAQAKAWYRPRTPAAVHDSIHYNQVGYNEIGRESARNALILLGETHDTDEKTTLRFVNWTGYEEVDAIKASAAANYATLVVPIVSPCYRAKSVGYTVSQGLQYVDYDLLSPHLDEGALSAVDMEGYVKVVSNGFLDHLSALPEKCCCGTNLWAALKHDHYYYANGANWGVHSSGKVYSVTIPVSPGERIFASSFGKAGENGSSSSNGIRTTFFDDRYSVIKTLKPAETYAEFSANGGYLTAPEGAAYINIAMWTNSDEWEIYLLDRPHVFGEWTELRAPTYISDGEQTRVCTVCGEVERVVIPKLTPDLNGDGAVNILDVSALLNYLAQSSATDEKYDITCDGTVNILDVTALLDMLSGENSAKQYKAERNVI